MIPRFGPIDQFLYLRFRLIETTFNFIACLAIPPYAINMGTHRVLIEAALQIGNATLAGPARRNAALGPADTPLPFSLSADYVVRSVHDC